jgi:hypothetical protein
MKNGVLPFQGVGTYFAGKRKDKFFDVDGHDRVLCLGFVKSGAKFAEIDGYL